MSKWKILGPAVRAIREAQGRPGSQFATECRMSHAYLCNVEKKRKYPPLEVIERIAAALDVELEAIAYELPADDEAVAA